MIRPIATEEERIRLIRTCQQSGLTASEWCRQNGISRNTYHTWLTRLRRKGVIETAATIPTVISSEPYHQDIVKVELTKGCIDLMQPSEETKQEVPLESARSQSARAVMEITVGTVKIKVTNMVNPQLLAQTIQMLGGGMGC